MAERRGTKGLELWCRKMTEGYAGVRVDNMTTSWRNGLAFCALIHHFRPDLIEFDKLDKADVYGNNELAFRVAEHHLGIPALLDPEDMVEYEVPDRLSILTYLSQFYQAFESQRAKDLSPTKRPQTPPEPLAAAVSPPDTVRITVGRARREPCAHCDFPVFLAERLSVGRRVFHRACFRCARCTAPLSLANCYETESGLFCCEVCPDEAEAPAARPLSDEEKGGLAAPDEYSSSCEAALEELSPSSTLTPTSAARTQFFLSQMQPPEVAAPEPCDISLVQVEAEAPPEGDYPEDLNPFGDEGVEEEEEEEEARPVPAARTKRKGAASPPASLNPFEEAPPSEPESSKTGSDSSLSSRKKKPAPPPPGTMRSRKSKRAPLPPVAQPRRLIAAPALSPDDLEDKSAAGPWKRRRAPSPLRPVPPKRAVPALPLPEIRRELDTIEIQQRGLENQGVRLEQIIRERCEGGGPGDRPPPEVEDLILQLFELVNEKNELFRRQAELMYLRRQQRLEEEQADVEHQVRCLMSQPETAKTDYDKVMEEALIGRLVEIVERRNQIIDCLESERQRNLDEDNTISAQLSRYNAQRAPPKKKKKHKRLTKMLEPFKPRKRDKQ